MITQPIYWKSQILYCTSELRKKAGQKRWSELSVGRLERTIMMACYAVRKLYESGHIDKSVFYSKISIKAHKSLGGRACQNNWQKIDLHYDLNNAEETTKEFSYICNQIIHSFVFIPVLIGKKDKGLAGIAFNSDKSSKNFLYYLELWDLINVLGQSGDGYIGKPTVFNVGGSGELGLIDCKND